MSAANAPTDHPDPISLAIGEPAESPPQPVVDAAVRALREGRARYGPPPGLPELRDRIADDQRSRNGLPWSAENVLVTAGGKPAILDTLRCILEAGDEVLVLAPHWPTFIDQVGWAGGRAVVVASDADMLPIPEAIDAACTERTRAVILNQPTNPTSRSLTRDLLVRIGDVAARRNLWVIADQVYAELALDGPCDLLLDAHPELRERTVVVESFSKRFAMTGYRLGAACGPAPLIDAMTRLTSASSTHANVVAQYAGIAALALDDDWITAQRARYRERRDRGLAALAGIEGVQCARPDSAFYLFPSIAEWMTAHGFASDENVADALRSGAGLSVSPGSAFGAPGHLRLSCGLADATLDRALGRLRGFLQGA